MKLKKLDIDITVDENNLRLMSATDIETNILEEIKQHKQGLISYINKSKKKQILPFVKNVSQGDNIKLTQPQLRLFLLYKFAPESLAYNLPQAYQINGRINKAKLQDVFTNLIRRHESLRTGFSINEKNEPVQKILTNFEFSIDHYQGNLETVDSILDQFVRPFDLLRAPLIRVGLVEASDESYFLLVDMHHIISDGVSQQVLMEEFAALYNDEDLAVAQLNYKDYLSWYHSAGYQAAILEQKSFWLEEFSNYKKTTELPTDFKRLDKTTFKGKAASFSIDESKTKILKRIAENSNTSLFAVLLSIYSTFIHKLTGDEEVVIGTPIAGRKLRELHGMIGMFVNTLAIRLFPQSNLSFKTYLKKVSRKSLTCFDHQDYPFEELVRDLKVDRNIGQNPLFNTILEFNNIEDGSASIPVQDLDITPYPIKPATSKLDLILHVKEAESQLSFTFEYSTELFLPETINGFFNYLENLITQVTTSENTLLSDLTLLSPLDRQKLLHLSECREASYPAESTIVDLFERRALEFADREAVGFKDEVLTYGQLNARANKLAHRLQNNGVTNNQVVALLMDKNIDTLVGMLGILKAGGAYLPIDVNYPEDRIQYILSNSRVSLVVTHKAYLKLASENIQCICIEDTAEEPSTNLTTICSPGDLCYVLYTSGTTGNPKGVMIEHRNVVRLLFNDRFQFDFCENDVWTMFHSQCFDFSVWEVYGALLYGGKVVIVSSQDARDPRSYLKLIETQGVTVLNQTPTAFYSLIDALVESEVKLPNVRYVIFGGEALAPAKLKKWYGRCPDTTLVNMFGITETTVHVTYKEIGEKEIEQNISNIGRPIPTMSIFVLDSNRQLVPMGIIGEMYVGGLGLGRGYLNNEILTRERFIPSPFMPGERLYRTGDLARILSNGEIEYKGRSDHQVQLRGFRIELGEIEYHLAQQEHVDQAVVISTSDAEERQYLCAYIVGKSKLPVEEIRAYLGKKVPSYMVPAYIIQIDKIPFTSNNKLDRDKLPKPGTEALNNYIAPRHEAEKKMSAVWSRLLSVEKVGVRDNYFSLGGDSLKAIGLIAEINRELETSLTIADLYSHHTIEELTALSNEAKHRDDDKLLQAKKDLTTFQREYREKNDFPETFEEVYPMNGVEKGMVFHSMKLRYSDDNLHNIIYHEQNIYPVYIDDFDYKLFEKALSLVVSKHGELRKIFDLNNLTHIILKEVQPELNYDDISHLSPDAQEAHIKAKMDEQKRKRKKLSFSILWRVTMFKVSSHRHYLLFDMHHSLLDGWSLSSFITELNNTYFQLRIKKDYKLKPLRCSYEDQILGELAAAKAGNSVQYWKEELLGYERLSFPPTGLEHEYRSRFFDLGIDLRKDLESLALELNTNFKHICFAAYVYMMKMFTYADDVVVGIVTNNRPLVPDGEELLGCYLNTVPFRASLSDNVTWKGFLEYIENKLRTLKQHERIPFYKIVEIIEERKGEKNPVFDTSFNYIDFRVFNEIIEEEEQNVHEHFGFNFENYMNNNTLFDLHVFAHGGGFELVLTYSTSIINENLAARLYHYYKNILHNFLHALDEKADQAQVIPDFEKDQLKGIADWVGVNYPSESTIVDIFERNVELFPHREAVVFEERAITYKALNEQANQLANQLIKQGVKSNQLVGLLMDKTLETLTGMLGILKAGGAYLPIDVNYPKDRINYILSNSKVQLLVTQRQYAALGSEGIGLIYLEDSMNAPIDNLNVKRQPDDLAYILYTSGTTGKPKGVMIEDKNVIRLLFNDAFQFQFSAYDVWSMFHNHCFDFSVWEIYGALLYGGKVVVVSPQDARDPHRFARVLQSHNVTVLNQTPTAFYNLIEASFDDSITLDKLRYIIFGGEALSPSRLSRWYTSYPQVKLINMYGITETTVHSTYKEIGESEIADNRSNIGRPLPTSSIYILNSKKELLPQGVIGEIYVGGLGVGRGYLNNESLTKERFIKSPYGAERLYRSGDLARILPDGEMEYKGRCDHQVQLRGFRIELGEIEYHLNQYAKVDQAVVIAATDDAQHAYLCAYVLSKEKLTIEDVRTYLEKKLPSYMIPAYIIQIDKIPFTTNNKLDRTKLPKPGIGQSTNYVAARTNEEEKLAAIWCIHLKLERVGVHDNYFSLGGDSVRAIALISEINKEFKTELTIADLYSNQCIEDLTQVLEEARGRDDSELSVAKEGLITFQQEFRIKNSFLDTYEEVYPMNGVEKGMVFHSLNARQNHTDVHHIMYHEQTVYPIYLEDFDLDLFKHALRLLIKKHGALRKIYDLANMAHIVLKEIAPSISYADISQLSKEEQDTYVMSKKQEDKLRATGLSGELLWRMHVTKIKSNYHLLQFDMHHSLFDGWSLSSFVTELNNLYIKLVEDRSYVPANLRCSYSDQILSELAASKRKPSIDYWKEELDEYVRFPLAKTGKKHEYAQREFELDLDLKARLEGLASELKTNLKHLCFAAYLYTMKLFTHNNDLLVGIVTNNRPVVPDGGELLGCYLNTVPFRAKIESKMTWRNLINYVEGKLKELKKHEQMAFSDILRVTKNHMQDENPLFDVSFNYIDFKVFDNIIGHEQRLDEVNHFDNDVNINTLFDLHVQSHMGFQLVLRYSTKVLDASFEDRIYTYFNNILRQFVNQTDSQITNEVILGEDEKLKIQAALNDTDHSYNVPHLILNQFEKLVHEIPGYIAVQGSQKILTYDEFNKRANQMARYLRQQGVCKQNVVGMFLPRSEDMMVCIYAVLKLGAIYLPLDINNPIVRNDYILSNANATFVLYRKETYPSDAFEGVQLSMEDDTIETFADNNLNEVLDENDIAYIIYTSGSTGRPKGVPIRHNALHNRLNWMQKQYPICSEDRILHKTRTTFDVSLWEIFWWSITGAGVYILPEGEERDMDRIKEVVVTHRVTTMHFVPSALNYFLHAVKGNPSEVACLKRVFSSGEALPIGAVTQFGDLLNKSNETDLVNLYGPTEAAIDVTYYDCFKHPNAPAVPIGKPIDNIKMYIVDRNNQLLPVGVRGEICIGGIGVFDGYLNNDELTAKVLIPNPADPTTKIYKTGDLGYWNDDGDIQYLGRIDNQIKVRGFRVELEEIEHHMQQLPGVSRAVVALYQHGTIQDNQIVAVVLRSDQQSFHSQYYKDQLRSTLPEYMIPTKFLELNSLELTKHDKLDRKTIVNYFEKIGTSQVYDARDPNEQEQILVDIFKKLLQVERVSITDNFFEAGGHSLLAIQFINKMETQFDKQVEFDDLMFMNIEQLTLKYFS